MKEKIIELKKQIATLDMQNNSLRKTISLQQLTIAKLEEQLHIEKLSTKVELSTIDKKSKLGA